MITEQKNGPASRINLLIVDDEEGFVNVIANRLGRRGIDATKALSGTDAIQSLCKEDLDVAVLDLKMEDLVKKICDAVRQGRDRYEFFSRINCRR